MSKNKKKMYGTGGKIKGFVENPNTELMKNGQMISKALHEGNTDPLYLALKGGGNALMGAGLSKGGFGESQGGSIMNNILPLVGNMEFEHGGTATKANVEVEGDEVAETPEGNLLKFKGASHAQGGIDATLPVGTDIYSDKVTIDGVTMADRKIKREASKSKLEKLLSRSDKVSESTYNRSLEKITIEEDKDMAIQNILNDSAQKFQMGGTTGDYLSILSTLAQGVTPYLQNQKQRSQTDPNINYFENYGQEGLEKLDSAKKFLDQSKDETLKSLDLSTNAAHSRNRSSARSVNTMRALDLTTDAQESRAKSDINKGYMDSVLNVIGQEAQFENAQDQAVMSGEREKDLADRSDKDNYLSNETSALVNMFSSVGSVGENLNAIKQRQVTQNLMNQLSDFGIVADDKGNLTTQ